MRILMLTLSYYPVLGGSEIFAQEIAERSVREGNEVDVITGLWDRGQKGFEVINGVNVYRVRMLKSKYPARYLFIFSYAFSSTLKALKLDRARNYDIIHSVVENAAGIAGAMVRRLTRKPHLTTMQGGIFLEQASLFRKVAMAIAEKWCFGNADMVHSISRHLVEQRADRFGARAAVIIPNGVDVQMFHPMNKRELRTKYGFSQDESIIISVCPGIFRGTKPSFNPEGYPNLIKALAVLSRDLPTLRLVTVGEGHKRKMFQALATKLGIVDRVTFLGSIPHQELPAYIGVADVFIRPRIAEGQGISYVEAMACGVPVIGANVGGTLDVIEHGKNGLLVSPQSVEEISAALRLILEDEATRNKFIAEGLRTVEQKFHWEAIFDKISQIYIELAKGKSGAQA